ncbi:hypothetical protein HNR65_002458 [Desulfosalsimonas propionicica]|uniref:Uncharacterized protein n=1 Tax=Desulfosalsimonas propionicica TaxID=332175 RepID=A0A7W0CAJ4_9BACT|nr:hypothetical protein [Desulfosalsimonas propionicica]
MASKKATVMSEEREGRPPAEKPEDLPAAAKVEQTDEESVALSIKGQAHQAYPNGLPHAK